jgi:hypothetical protein
MKSTRARIVVFSAAYVIIRTGVARLSLSERHPV